MCGRYYVEIDEREVAKKINKMISENHSFDYAQKEVFPGSQVLVLVKKQTGYTVDIMKWGIQLKSLCINARSETLHERYTFKQILDNRCLVVANGFYEWAQKGNKKTKIYIEKENCPLIYFAAIYNQQKELVIVTGESEQSMKAIHDRTPIIIQEEDIQAFLNHEIDYTVDNQDLHFTIV